MKPKRDDRPGDADGAMAQTRGQADERGPSLGRFRREGEIRLSASEHNEGEYAAMSSMTSVLGRLATYSGKTVSMEQALKTKSTMPANISWDSEAPVKPAADGLYASAAIPGNYKIV